MGPEPPQTRKGQQSFPFQTLPRRPERVSRKAAQTRLQYSKILLKVYFAQSVLGLNQELWGIPLTYLIIDLIFIIASITDKLDGYIARSRNQITIFGKFLDPIADKILVIVAMLMLVGSGKIPYWIPAIVVIREFMVSGYRLVEVQKNGNVIAASIWGKIKTATQMVGLILAFVDKNVFGAIFTSNLTGFDFALNLIVTIMLSISVVATIVSGVDYLKGSKELFKDSK